MGNYSSGPDPYIRRIKTYDDEPFTTGQIAEFAVWPRNYGNKAAKNCKVIISGENINTITLEAKTLGPEGESKKLPVDITGYKPGTFKLKFEVICDDEKSKYKGDNVEYKEYTWVGADMSHMLDNNNGNDDDDDISFEVIEKTTRNESEEFSQLIEDDNDVDGRVDDRGDVDWYKVKFKKSGKANFWVRPRHEDLDVDIAIFKAKSSNGSLYNGIEPAGKDGESNRSRKKAGEDDLVSITVEAGMYYYIKISHYGKIPSGSKGDKYWLRCKLNDGEDTSNRSKKTYNSIIDGFKVETNPKYQKRNGNTYCNVFAMDIMDAMGVPYGGHKNANGLADWFSKEGHSNGWKNVTPKEAAASANMGKPTIVIWKNPDGHGHISVVRPYNPSQPKHYSGVYIAQAGTSNFNYKPITYGFGKSKIPQLKYYTHE
ncbi:hypothetical protein [Marinisporobacter balticus]|uniref:Uncharacterized protein n=1 Tax=Marinisporobacter balticus TaxID=2018667 RepID=A0A4R2KH08_9FIRM|nr:hypothetical protein [Marinisporobacter balticus]TCO69268.1 hypothetical protein EV214_13345 [Marinisporobacter balticus]